MRKIMFWTTFIAEHLKSESTALCAQVAGLSSFCVFFELSIHGPRDDVPDNVPVCLCVVMMMTKPTTTLFVAAQCAYNYSSAGRSSGGSGAPLLAVAENLIVKIFL